MSHIQNQFFIACNEGNYKLAKAILLYNKDFDINLMDKYGNTPLIYASITNNYDIIELLLKYEADLNAQNDEGMTALHYAYSNKNKTIIDLLENNHADKNLTNILGKKPFEYKVSETGVPKYNLRNRSK